MNFPFVYQRDSMECGVTCLQMICKHLRREFPISFLSKICVSTTEGVSLKGITEAAEKIGLKTIAGKIRVDKLNQSPLPCILHWNQNHFVVLYKVKKGKIFYVADPGKGLVECTLEEFKQHWISTQSDGEEKGIAMFLEPTPAFYEMQIEDQPKEERSFKFLFGYIKQYRKYLLQSRKKSIGIRQLTAEIDYGRQ